MPCMPRARRWKLRQLDQVILASRAYLEPFSPAYKSSYRYIFLATKLRYQCGMKITRLKRSSSLGEFIIMPRLFLDYFLVLSFIASDVQPESSCEMSARVTTGSSSGGWTGMLQGS